jgi:hypothetical protein
LVVLAGFRRLRLLAGFPQARVPGHLSRRDCGGRLRSATQGGTVSDQARAFFGHLGDQGSDARLGRVRGSLRVDLVKGAGVDSWRVALDRGVAAVGHDRGEADCVVRIDAASFERMVEGRLNATVALLQGLVHIEGSVDLLWYFQKLFPAPPAPAAARTPSKKR